MTEKPTFNKKLEFLIRRRKKNSIKRTFKITNQQILKRDKEIFHLILIIFQLK